MIVGGSLSIVGAGATLAAAGWVSLAGALGEIDDYEASLREARRTRNIAISLVVAAGVMVACGIPLVVLGARQRDAAVRAAHRRVTFGVGSRGFGLRF